MSFKRSFLTGLILCFLLVGMAKMDVSAASYRIYVNRRTNIVNVVNRATGRTIRSMWCSTGKNYGTIRGTYSTCNKYRWRALFGGVYGQYSTRIHGHYLFHSVPYASTSKNKVKVSYYNKLGQQDSQGCVRMAVVDVKWIYDHCRLGTQVVIGETRKLVKPTRKKLKLSTQKTYSWDPTDPDPKNPYKVKLKWKPGTDKKVEYGQDFNIGDYLYVKSSFTKRKELLRHISTSGKINVKKPGRYTLKVTVRDPNTTLKTTKSFTFKVKNKPAASAGN